MKTIYCRNALFCSLMAALCLPSLYAQVGRGGPNSTASRGRGGNPGGGGRLEGGGRPGGGRQGGGRQGGSSNGIRVGGAPVRVPFGGGVSNQPAGPRRQPTVNRAPALNPGLDRVPGLSERRANDSRRDATGRPAQGYSANRSNDTRLNQSGGVTGRARLPNTADITRDLRRGVNPSRIVNQPFIGNAIDLNNRRVNIGPNSYRPPYYRHSGYHGYWNGNRGYGGSSQFGSGFVNGLGAGLGYGLGATISGYGGGYGGGYGPGWGWGLGTGYGYGGSGRYGYGYRPLGWGLGGWGLGSLIYRSGYLGYSNPYYAGSTTSVYNYSEPIPVLYNTSVTVEESDQGTADQVLNDAVAAFKDNNYDAALDITNKGIAQYPDDAVLHEFRSLVLFARQDYQQSAATIHSVLAVGPGWDWTTLSSMYADVAIYTDHLRALESFTKANPQDAASRFLLAYHYITCGYPDAASRQLQQVVKLAPTDRVAADLLKFVSPPAADESSAEAEVSASSQQESSQPVSEPIDPKSLAGSWSATRDDGSHFSLRLTNDGNFTWSFSQKNQAAQQFGGTYSVDGDVLVLERKDGGSLLGKVTQHGDGGFNFKLLGAPDSDPGLDFGR